jgi:hypothetical protein
MQSFIGWLQPNAYRVVVQRPFALERRSNKRPHRSGLPRNISRIEHGVFILRQCQCLMAGALFPCRTGPLVPREIGKLGTTKLGTEIGEIGDRRDVSR